MGIVFTIIVGFLVGLVARAVLPGRQTMGIIMTTLLGVAGAFAAGWAGQQLGYYKLGEAPGFIASVLGAMVLLFVWSKLMNR